MPKYYENAAGVSLMVNRMISTCSLHSEDPIRNAMYKLERLSTLPPDAIQSVEDKYVVLSILNECQRLLARAEIEIRLTGFRELQLKEAAE